MVTIGVHLVDELVFYCVVGMIGLLLQFVANGFAVSFSQCLFAGVRVQWEL